jgi:uncharacterized membrane protein YeaQ/YmgE (transglycosylase-associated protein family)
MLVGVRLRVRRQDVIPHVILENLGHKRVDRAPARGERVQSPLAVDVLGQELLDGRDLTPYALDAIDQLLLLAHGVRHLEWYTKEGYTRQAFGDDPGTPNALGDGMYIIWWVIVGLIAGWATGKIMRGAGYGPLMDIVLGIVGAVIGGWIVTALGFGGGGMIYTIIVAILGACILVAVARMLSGRRSVV